MPKRKNTSTAAATIAAVPVALSLLAPAIGTSTAAGSAPSAARRSARATSGARAKEFSVPITNLRAWADKVVVSLSNVQIEGNSKVHKIADDCELHFGAHTSGFQGDPDGLVLEPMNVCVQPFPGKSEQNDNDWIAFATRLKGTTVTASGVPRIWPEHLSGGGDSNPDHAVEIHPLTTLVSGGTTFDFAPNIFAGEYKGGVAEESALAIVERTAVTVSRNGTSADIAFRGGRIGNFTLLEIEIDRASITGDGAGSFRMNADVALDNGTVVPVRVVTIAGTPMNATIAKARTGSRARIDLEALVLFSLSPEALLEAANKSTGAAVNVDRAIQLILYGTPEDQ
jgi:hypothetical protein